MLIAAAAASLAAGAAQADINMVRVQDNPSFGGTIYDQVTGAYARRDFYGFESTTKYASQAAYEAGTPAAGAVNLSGAHGTYFTASNGQVFGQYGGGGTPLGRWDLATGALTASAAAAGFDGASFNWGGGSSYDVMQDATGMYLFGGNDSDNAWRLARLNTDLTLGPAVTFNLAGDTAGWGFMAGGRMWGNTSYNLPDINFSADAATGALTNPGIHLTGLGPSNYITHADYIEATDTLYIWSPAGDGGLFKATGVAAELGLAQPGAGGVPEPASWALMILGFTGLGATLRQRRARLQPCG